MLTLPLTSRRLLVVLVLLSAGAVVLAVWAWGRLRGPRAVRASGRAGLLVLCQLTAVLAVAAALNDFGYFYGSWSELLGRPQPAGHEAFTADPHSGGPVTSGAGHLVGPDRAAHSAHPERDGEVVSVRLDGRRSGLSQPALVYLPPEYFQPRYARRTFPGVEVFTGYPGQAENLVKRLHYPAALLRQERAGRAVPMILVMMRPSPAFPRDTECTDVVRGPQALTYLVQDVPADVTALFRVSATGWGAIGDSTGGYCAAKIAMTDSYVFRAAVSLSGYFSALRDRTTGDLWGGSPLVRRSNDLTARLADLPPPPVSLLLTASRTEKSGQAYRALRRFTALVRPPLVVDTLIKASGGHNFQTWSSELPAALTWLSDRLPAPPAGPSGSPTRLPPTGKVAAAPGR